MTTRLQEARDELFSCLDPVVPKGAAVSLSQVCNAIESLIDAKLSEQAESRGDGREGMPAPTEEEFERSFGSVPEMRGFVEQRQPVAEGDEEGASVGELKVKLAHMTEMRDAMIELHRNAMESVVLCTSERQAAEERASQAEEKLAELREKYNDLILSVGWVHKGETRHDTAKRYILAAENQNNPAADAEPRPGGG